MSLTCSRGRANLMVSEPIGSGGASAAVNAGRACALLVGLPAARVLEAVELRPWVGRLMGHSTSSEINRSMSAGSSQSDGGRPPSRLCSRTHTRPSSPMSL